MTREEHQPVSEAPSQSVWRMALPSLAVSLTLLAVAVLAAVVLVQMRREADRSLQEIAEAVEASAELEQSVVQWWKGLDEYVDTGDEALVRDLPGLQQPTDRYLLHIEKLELGREGKQTIARFRQEYIVVLEELQPILSNSSTEERQATADRLINGFILPRFLDATQQQRELTQQALQQAQERNRALTRWTGWTLLLLGVVGAGAGTLAGFGLARGMQRQLVQLSVPIQTAAGSLHGVVGPLQVSTSGNIDQLEDSLHDLAGHVASVVDRLQAAERQSLRKDQMAALGQLAAGLAHELRNPLTSMKTLVESARSNGAAGTLDERDLEVMDEEIRRLDGTLQSFLDYARPPQLNTTSVDLRDVIGKTVQLVKARADQQSIDIETELPAHPLTLVADSGQLRQVLLNLLLNAFDSVGPGGRVVLEVEPAGDGDRELLIRVRDNGPGIPDSVRDRLFDPFVSSKSSGTGLGLTICRRIVENHGGRIVAENRPDGGAEFTIRLPAEKPREDRRPALSRAGDGTSERDID